MSLKVGADPSATAHLFKQQLEGHPAFENTELRVHESNGRPYDFWRVDAVDLQDGGTRPLVEINPQGSTRPGEPHRAYWNVHVRTHGDPETAYSVAQEFARLAERLALPVGNGDIRLVD